MQKREKAGLTRLLTGKVLSILSIGAILFVSLFVVLQEKPKVQAATSSTLNFQARLLNSSGAIVADGYYNIEFKLYSASSGGSPLWTETWYDSNGVTAGNDNRIQVRSGYVSVYLGNQTSFPGTINWDQDLYLTMNVGGTTQSASPTWDGEMNPRLKLTAVPYAFRAGQLAKLTGSDTSTLDFATQTGSRSILLPDESGTLCIQSSSNCGFNTDTSITLQDAYNATSGNALTTTNSRDLTVTLADTATDSNMIVNIASGSSGRFAVQNNGTDVLGVTSSTITLSANVSVAGSNTLTVGTGTTTLGGSLLANGDATIGNATTDRLTVTSQILGASPLVFQGASDNGFTTTFTFAEPTANNTITFPDASGTVQLAPTSGSYLQQVPSSTAVNTVTPTANNVVGLTVNGTSGTAATAAIFNQSQAADGVNLNLTNSAGTQTNGLAITRNGAGTTTNLLNLTNTSGTATNALNISGTFTNYISATNLTVTNAGNADFAGTLTAGTADAFQVSSGGAVTAVGVNSGSGLLQGTGGLTLTGAISVTNNGASTIGLNTGTSTGAVNIGNSAAGAITLQSGTSTEVIGAANTTGTAGAKSLIIDSAATSTYNVVALQVANTDRGYLSATSSGNIGLYGTGTGALYLNYESGSGGVFFGSGAGSSVGSVSSAGNADFAGTLTAGTGDAFQVSSGGAVTAVGVNSGSGLLQGTGGITVSGNTTLAATAGNTVGIGNATGAVTITGSSASSFILNGVTVSATEFNLLDGRDTQLVDTTDAVATAITGTGALNAGSITSGFGSIDTGADNITTTGTVQGTTSVLTQALDRTSAGTLTIGATTANAITLGQSGVTTTNAGALTVTQALTVNSTAAFNGVSTFNTDADFALSGSENVSIAYSGSAPTADFLSMTNTGLSTTTDGVDGLSIDFYQGADGAADTNYGAGITFNTSVDHAGDIGAGLSVSVNNTSTAGSQYGIGITNLDTATNATTEALLVITNMEGSADKVTDYLKIQSIAIADTSADAIDVSDANLYNAINVGANNIVGTTAVINFDNFDVASTGDITTAGDLALNGGDLTSTVALNIGSGTNTALTLNSGTTGTINIGTDASAETINIGNTGAAVKTVYIGDSANANIVRIGSTTGAAATTIQGGSGGIVLAGTVTGAATDSILCKNGSNQISTCGGNTLSGYVTLQNAYANGNSITTTDNRDVTISLADTATDADLIVDILGTGNTFEIRDGGSAFLTAADGGTITQTFTGTTTTASTITANSLTSGSGLSVSSSSTSLTGDLVTIQATGNSGSSLTGNALKVGLTGTTASGNSVALNVTNGNTGSSAYVARFNDDGTYTDSSPVVITGAGYLGVGTTAPLTTLDVAGSTRISGSSSSVLTGSIDPTASVAVVGVGTAFTTELLVGDRITVSGETRTVISITDNTHLIVDTAFSDNPNDSSVDRLPAGLIVRDSSNAYNFAVSSEGNILQQASLDGTFGLKIKNYSSGSSYAGSSVVLEADTANNVGGLFKLNSAYPSGVVGTLNPNDLGFANISTTGGTVNGNITLYNGNSNGNINFAAGASSTPNVRIDKGVSRVLTGSINNIASTSITSSQATGTKFLSEVMVGDQIVVSGETRTVTAVTANDALTVSVAFTDTANDTSPDVIPAVLTVSGTTNIQGHTSIGSGSAPDKGLTQIDTALGATAHTSTLLTSETLTTLNSLSTGYAGSITKLTVNPGSAPTFGAIVGSESYAEVASGNSQNFSTSYIYGGASVMSHGGTGTVTTGVGLSGTVQNLSTGTITNAMGISANIKNWTTGTITNGYGINIGSAAGTNITNNYGILVQSQTVGTSDVGVAIGAAETQTLWVCNDFASTACNSAPSASSGIAFGSARDTNLYRSAADTLKTDDNFVIGGATTVGTNGTTVSCNSTTCAIGAASIDNYSAVLVDANIASVEATMPSPTTTTSGKVVYVTAADGSEDFTLVLNDGEATEINIAMRENTTATLIWNGNDWTAAGASSSTTLQSAYQNTQGSAGAAELLVSQSGSNYDGLTIRNATTSGSVTGITGALLEVQTANGSNLLSINNNATEYANNGGAESTTFTMWTAAPAGGTVTQYSTAGDYIATGLKSTSVATSAVANHGVRNTLTSSLTSNLKYAVSFAVRGTTNFTTLDVVYSRDGTNTSTTSCTTGQTVTTGKWTRITCSFTAPSSGITSSNAIFIRQSDATARTYYVDNLSVTISADVNHAADGSVDSALGTNWTNFGTLDGLTRDTSTIYDTSGSVNVDTPNSADRGVRNNLSITPSVSTQYLVSFYARSSNTFNDIRVRYSRDGGTDFESCVDYNTQSVSTSTWTKITCLFTTDSSAATDPDLIIDQPTASNRNFYVDALSVTLNTNNSNNVQVGGANKGGPTTLFTLDRGSSAPIAANNDAYLGSMYYDTTTGKIQCYEADGWGACGSAPDNIVNLNPEYAGAVLNGSGVGTMTADFCGNGGGLSVNTSLCASGEARNYYRWTSPQATQQTYSIYVTYQLPATFKNFESDDTVRLTARTDSTSNAAVTYEMYRSQSGSITQCGSGETTVVTSANTWQTVGINGNESTGCSFSTSSASAFVIFKVNVKANSNANAYVGTLSFTTTGN